MRAFENLRIGSKIGILVFFLSALAALMAALGIQTMLTYDAQITEISRASERTVIGERVNGTILAVVMDSRGIYMSRDRAEAEKFTKPLLANLVRMDKLMGEWKALLPAEQVSAFAKAEANAKKFMEFRTELVRLGLEVGNPTAREYGDNEANRTVRAALNREIESLASINDALIDKSRAELDRYYRQQMILLCSLAVGGALLGFAFAALMARRFIVRPISTLTATMKALVAGRTDSEIAGVTRADELGEMARALEVFRENIIKTAEMERAKQIEDAAKTSRAAKMTELTTSFGAQIDSVVNELAHSATDLQGLAETMAGTAEQTQQQSSAVTAAAEQASLNVQTVASAAEELSAAIAEIGRQVAGSTQATSQAVSETENTNREIDALATSAQKIGDVLKLINDIAQQTNLLALNATIEAARAGEAGKGFAVVAAEVKSLAGQTAKATDDISATVDEIQAATQRSVQAVQRIGTTISRVDNIAAAIAAAVEEQGAATQEIARNVQQASEGTAAVTSNILGVSKAADKTGSASAQVLGSASELSTKSVSLRGQVDSFIAQLSAA